MNDSNVVTIKTEAAHNEYLRTCPPAELSNEDLLDAQRATAADIERDGNNNELTERYNTLAIEYGVRADRGEQLVSDEELRLHAHNLEWFFSNDAVSIDDEDFKSYLTEDGIEISAAVGVSMILSRPASLATCEELVFFTSIITRRLDGNAENSDLLVERLKTLHAADADRHGGLCAECGKPMSQT